MKIFIKPHWNKYECCDIVLNRIESDYRIKPKLIMANLELLSSNDGHINVNVYKTGQIYHVLAYNASLQEYYKMFQSVLDDEQEKKFEELYSKVKYQEILDTLLLDNTF